MAFDNSEDSIEDGQPIRLYRFSLNDKVWRYTGADANVVKGGFTWEAVPISDEGVSQTGEASTDATTINTVTTITPAQLYMRYPPASPVQVAIFEAHEDGDEVRAVYVGEITQCDVSSPGSAVLTAETIAASMSREGLRLGWQRTCPYALYDAVTCKVDKSLYAFTGTVSTVVDNVVTMPALAGDTSGRFAGGFIEWSDPVRGLERRAVESHSTSALTLFGTADGVVAGTLITAYAGCARTTAACATFNNLGNYGGAPALQGKSPFDGSPVF